ncbi:MAG: hypothetical protein H5T64_08175 [Chloroflexi bacterium]|nr:hypothetical protein [Chloroflexota bacterium]
MKEERRYPGIVGPIILIVVGVLLLLNTLGYLSWGIWASLWRFWPVLLILAGLEIIVSRLRSPIVYLLMIAVTLTVVLGVIGLSLVWGQRPISTAAGSLVIAEEMAGATSARVELSIDAGELKVAALMDSPNLVTGRVDYGPDSGEPQKSLVVSGGQAQFYLRSGRQGRLFWLPGSKTGDIWDLQFTSEIPLALRVNAGAGRVNLDLHELQVTNLDVNVAAGTVIITFPERGTVRADLNGAAAEWQLRVPEGVGARINTAGLVNVRVDSSRFLRTKEGYETVNFATARNRVEIDLKAAVSSVDIR